MPEALVDSNVLLGFRSERDHWHRMAREIVTAMDAGDLPRGRVTNYALPEVLNPIQKLAGHETAVETLTFLKESGGFRVHHLAQEDFARGQVVFRRHPGVELPDAITAAYMDRTGLEYIYSFDDDFDRFDGVTRLTTATNPFDPADDG